MITRTSPRSQPRVSHLTMGFASQGADTVSLVDPVRLGPHCKIEVPVMLFATDHLSGRWGKPAATYLAEFLDEYSGRFGSYVSPNGRVFFLIHKGNEELDEVDRFLGVSEAVIRYDHDMDETIDHGLVFLGRGDNETVRARAHRWGLIPPSLHFTHDSYLQWLRDQHPCGCLQHPPTDDEERSVA